MKALVLLALPMLAVPALAQDGFPAVDATGMGIYAMDPAVKQAARGGTSHVTRRASPSAGLSDRQICAKVPEFKALRGAGDPRVIEVVRLCRQKGYATGD